MNYTPSIDLVSAFILFGVLQALGLFSIFLVARRKAGNLEFAILMLLLALIEVEAFLSYSGYIIYCPFFVNASPPLVLMLGPLSFRVVRKLLGMSLSEKYELLHFIPALAYFGYSFLFFVQPVDFKLYAVLRSFHPEAVAEEIRPLFAIDPLHIRGFVVVEGLAIHLFGYAIASVFQLVHVNKTHGTKWAYFWVSGIFVGSIVFLMTGGVVNGYVLFKSLLPGYFTDLFSVALVYATSIYWVAAAVFQRKAGDKYAKSGLTPEFQQSKLHTLRTIMETQKPYKSPSFSLAELARLSRISPHQASQIINTGTGMSFNDFVNLYRIKEAQDVLRSTQCAAIKVEVLAYELGYKSKSAFFNSFKRHTDTTPARYREFAQKSLG